MEYRRRLRDGKLRSAGNSRAFTLIELLSVILIISLLLSITVGISIVARNKAYRGKCLAQIVEMHGQLAEYKVKNGGYPPSLSNIVAMLPPQPQWAYSNGLPVDPWGQPYQYSAKGALSYVLFSKGPDKVTGGDADSGDDVKK